jgi:O-antigen/teichoic acid export membrane protein
MSFRKKLFKNVIILGGYSYSSQILGFLSSIVLSRLLLPKEYGFVALITVFTGFINQFSDAGLSYIIIRSDYKKLFHSTIHYLAVVIGVMLTLIVIALAYPISVFYKDHALILPTIVMSSTFILRSLITVPYGILSKELKFNFLGIIDLSCATLEISLMILFAYLKFSYWSLILPSIFGNICRIGLYYYKTGLRFKILKTKYLVVGFRKAKSIIGNLTGFNMLNYWARNSDNLIIGKVFGASSLGIYDRAYKLLNLALGVMTNLFGKVLLPSLKDHGDQGGDVNKEYLNILGVISLLNFPASIILIFFAKPLVILLWSKAWIEVAGLLPYIGILILTQTLNSTTGNIFILYKKENILMKIGIPTNLAIISAIVLGSFFSMLHVLRFYSIVFIAIDIPFVMYYGFKKSFGFESKVILQFWMPKVLLSVLLVLSVWMATTWLTLLLMALYFIHLIINQKEDITKTFSFVTNKLSNRKLKGLR